MRTRELPLNLNNRPVMSERNEQDVTLRHRHGRKGEATEYHEYDFVTPRFVAQKCGEYWIVGINYPDKVLEMTNEHYPTEETARAEAKRLADIFAYRLKHWLSPLPHSLLRQEPLSHGPQSL